MTTRRLPEAPKGDVHEEMKGMKAGNEGSDRDEMMRHGHRSFKSLLTVVFEI